MAEIIENLVSTIIPVYNRPQMLMEAVDSVLAQTYRPIEIIISDDGSGDETRRVIREMAQTHPSKIRYIFNKNQGAGLAREAGRQLARGEFIQYLDSDDLLRPRKFEIQVEALRRNPVCGIAYGYICLHPQDGPPLKEPAKWTGKTFSTLFPALLVDRWWNTDCPLFRRTVCDAVGPWSNLRWGQDWEYDARIGSLGTRLVHCKEFVCDQRQHGGMRQTSPANQIEPERLLVEKALHETLYCCAKKAGITSESPEMQHFARWVFLTARWLGSLGMNREAKQCLQLAMVAAGIEKRMLTDMRLYKVFTEIIGWRVVSKFFIITDKFRGTPGKKTILWSWSQKDMAILPSQQEKQ